jgi:hypothetical protein
MEYISPSKAREQGFKLVYNDESSKFTLLREDGCIVLESEEDDKEDLYLIYARKNF